MNNRTRSPQNLIADGDKALTEGKTALGASSPA